MVARIAAASAAFFVCAGAVHANCQPRESIAEKLSKHYGEVQTHAGTRVILGMTHIVEVWSGPVGSWTIIQTNEAGISCVLQSGRNWGPVHRHKAIAPGTPG